ncbi:hypothetical protein V6N13_095585 [Hibiscus sabdariffa]
MLSSLVVFSQTNTTAAHLKGGANDDNWNPHTNRKPAIGRLQKSEAHVEERMEVIVIAGYITYEKMHIARDYLEKIAREACGVKPEQMKRTSK